MHKKVHGGDRRLVELSLTGEGRALMARLVPRAQRFQAEIEARLGAALPGLEAALDRLMATHPETGNADPGPDGPASRRNGR